jgi:hypothetical protein
MESRGAKRSQQEAARASICFAKNGQLLKPAFDPLPEEVLGSVFFPAILLQGDRRGGSSLIVNFGASPFAFPPAAPYCGLAQDREGVLPASSPLCYIVADQMRHPTAVIIEPTAELAEQTFSFVAQACQRVPEPRPQVRLLSAAAGHLKRAHEDHLDIAVGTSGKLLAMVQQGTLSLSQVRLFILDEADKLLSTGRGPLLELFSRCPGGGTGQHRLQVLSLLVLSSSSYPPTHPSLVLLGLLLLGDAALAADPRPRAADVREPHLDRLEGLRGGPRGRAPRRLPRAPRPLPRRHPLRGETLDPRMPTLT